jgi:hypothetical protein
MNIVVISQIFWKGLTNRSNEIRINEIRKRQGPTVLLNYAQKFLTKFIF